MPRVTARSRPPAKWLVFRGPVRAGDPTAACISQGVVLDSSTREGRRTTRRPRASEIPATVAIVALRRGDHERGEAARRGRAVTELPRPIGSPAVHVARRREGAGVGVAD